jgi:hypothetical protein
MDIFKIYDGGAIMGDNLVHQITELHPVQKGMIGVLLLPLVYVSPPLVRLTLVATHILAYTEPNSKRGAVSRKYWQEPATGDHHRTAAV